jgi:hypothetical protein
LRYESTINRNFAYAAKTLEHLQAGREDEANPSTVPLKVA